jgi:hypothetical protein
MGYNFHCFNATNRNECTSCNSKGDVILDKNKPLTCPHNETFELKLMGESVAGAIGPKMTKQQIVVDRKQRSRKHFKNEVLPTIQDKDARKHHLNKAGFKS